MLKQLLNADLRASKKYQRQFSEGDSEQRLHVLNQISEAKAAGTISHIDSELQQLFNSSLACEEDTDAAGERWLLGELRADLRGTSAAPARHQIDAGAWLREAARRGAADVVVLAACELGPKAKAAEARLDAVTLEVFAPSEGR